MKCGTIIITGTLTLWISLVESLFLLGLLRMILSDLFYRLSWCFDDDTEWFILSFVHWTVVNTDTWFNVLYTRRQQYSSTQWSKCCGLTNHSQVSLQQISNHCDRVQHYCQLWYKKKRFWCCSLLCSLGTHLVTISSGQWQLHMYKKMFR